MIEVQLSGRVAVLVDGESVDLGATKSKAVLAVLALSAGSPVAVSRLVDLVWGDDPPRTAEKTLQTYVGQLRRACGAELIERVGDSYCLQVDAAAVDLVRFERLLDHGQVNEALDLWQGPPLAGLAASALDPVVARLVERFLGATETALGAKIEAGRGPEEIGRLRELLADHPLREGLWGLLMRALYQADRQADALRAYAEAREHLVEGLGIEPGPALRLLEQQVLAHDPDLTGDSVSADNGGLVDEAGRSFLFTDIADSTGLWARHPDEMATVLADHDAIVQAAVIEQVGEVFKHTGDGLLVSFPTAGAAVQAAGKAQLELQRLAVGGEPVAVRMAVSTGRAQSRDGDWFGPPLNIAARLLEAAHGGQILVAGASHDQLGNDIDTALSTSDLGVLSLRGLSRPERVHQVLHPSLPRRFPPLRTVLARADAENSDFPPQLEYRHGVPFVGREEQRTAMRAAWEQAMAGHGPEFVLLAGEPGVGKTRLAAEVVRSIHEDHGATVVYGRCAEDHPSPFRPFTEALTAYGRARSDSELRTEMGPRPEYLAPVIPLLLDRFPDIVSRPVLDDSGQLQVFDAVTSFLEIASSSPLVIVLDDIHWADRASLDLLRHLVRHLQGGRLLVIGTYRDVEVDRTHPLARVLADLRREERVRRIPVRGVDGDESVALTEAVLGHELTATGRELAMRAGVEAGGNPFFLQEMLRHFMESGVLVRQKGRWSATDASMVEASVPEGIREVVGRRLDQVSEPCNRLLQTASALVGDIDIDVLVAVADIAEDEVLDLLDECLEAGLLIDAVRSGRYEFSHALIRQTLYGEFSTARRLRLHRRIADALVASGRSDDATTEAVAHHYLAAASTSDAETVVHWARTAAELATARFAFEEAVNLLKQALEIAEGTLDADDMILLLADLAGARIRAQAIDDACVTLEQLLGETVNASPEPVVRAAIAVSRAALSRLFLGEVLADRVRMLFAQAEAAKVQPALRAALEVELLVSGEREVRLGDLTDGLERMEDVILDRVITVSDRAICSRGELLAFRDEVRRVVAGRTSNTLREAAEWLDWTVGNKTWEPGSEMVSGEAHGILSRRQLVSTMWPVADAVRKGRDVEALETMARLAPLVPPLIRVYPGRWIDYECDRFEPGDLTWPAEFTPAIERTAGTYVSLHPHMRTHDPDPSVIRSLVERDPDASAIATLSFLVWETGMAELADVLWRRLEPARGLAGPTSGSSYVTAVDFSLGLLAELRGHTDEAIALHLDALDRSQDAGFVLDHGYIAWQLVRLLGSRNQSGDVAKARDLAATALAALQRTPYTRRKRMISEALDALPAGAGRLRRSAHWGTKGR